MAALFFPYYGFFPLGFPGKVFNETAQNTYARMMYSFSLRYGFIPLGFPSKVFNETSWLVDILGECYKRMTTNPK